jgi:RNA polymerase sigma-70 factor, ECF subfamily
VGRGDASDGLPSERFGMAGDGLPSERLGIAAGRVEYGAAVEAIRAGDRGAFGDLAERHRRELQVHCYRMLGSYDESEDLVQETFLRAWRRRETFEGRSTFRAWLYRIATNACLDFLDRHPRAPRPYADPPTVGSADAPRPQRLPWLQPFPDRLLDAVEPAAPGESEPDAVVVEKETIELAFLVAIQHLPPRQRAVLVLRDVLGWPAPETAGALDLTVAAVKSALQRARATVREHLPARRSEWAPGADPTAAERELLRRYLGFMEHRDVGALVDMFREDVRVTMPPHPIWFAGREELLARLAELYDPTSPYYIGEWRDVPTRANRQPAVAHYVRGPGDDVYRAQVLDVLHVEDGRIVAITAFMPQLFAAFGLPPTRDRP